MNRIILYVQDVVCLKAFYTRHFGFPVIEEIEGQWAVLLAGRTELALHLAGLPFRTGQTGDRQSNAKLVFTVDSPLPELRGRLEKAGVPVGTIKRYEGFTYSLCDGRDPEGNAFQLSSPDEAVSGLTRPPGRSSMTLDIATKERLRARQELRGSSMHFADLQELNNIFAKVKARFDEQNRDGLVCRHGFYRDCFVLKLQKASWTNDSMEEVQNQSGIFFSVWGTDESLRRDQVLYNIHALKLRQLKGYAITSRDFADDFRKHFISKRGDWPNVRMDYGPATLMQGWIESEPATLCRNIHALMERFVQLSSLIDRLLVLRRR